MQIGDPGRRFSPHLELGRLDLVIWLAANTYFHLQEAKWIVLQRSKSGDSWTAHEFHVPMPDAQNLVALLPKLGFPERQPRVQDVFDTVEMWLRDE